MKTTPELNEQKVPSRIQARKELLEQFLSNLRIWCDYDPNAFPTGYATTSEQAEQAKSLMNRNVLAVRAAIEEAGLSTVVGILGRPSHDALLNLFNDGEGYYGIIENLLEQAIGYYEHAASGTGLVGMPAEGLELEGAISRALRLAFRRRPPENEREVQDAVDVIFAALGISYTREQETAPVGPRAFKPDFVIAQLNMAVEVKLTTVKHGASATQEELAADISAFTTRWKRLLVIVYDCGVIDDPDRFKADNMKFFGVSVLIIKH